MDINAFLDRLLGVQEGSQGQWKACCPAHDDQRASLSVKRGEDGRILIHCHAGCKTGDIVEAMGLNMADLMPVRNDHDGQQGVKKKQSKTQRRINATYDYTDEHGVLLYQTVRYDPKDFRQRRQDGKGGWVWNLNGCRRVPYRWPNLLAQPEELLLIVEGEKDVDTAERLGFLATTNAGGADNWGEELSNAIADRPEVVIIADNDTAGRKRETQIAQLLHGRVGRLRIVRLFGEEPTSKHGKDLSNWVEEGGDQRQLCALIEAAQEFDPGSADDTQDCPEDPDEGAKSMATLLVELVEHQGVELRHDDMQQGWARYPVEDHHEVSAVQSKEFKRWLGKQYYGIHKGLPHKQAQSDAIDLIEARALYENELVTLHVRVAEHGDKYYLDLGDASRRAIEIGAEGWRINDEPPVWFRRPSGFLPLPEPTRGGTLSDLRPLLNVTDDQWPLVLGWLVATLRPRGPFPILSVSGEQGSAKSTFCRVVRGLVDPNRATLRAEPRTIEDLLLAANNSRVVALDNLSGARVAMSDGLCRIATGGGLSKRKLYTDDEECIIEVMRPVIVNGIEELTGRSDLVDRSLLISLPAINQEQRRAEKDFWQDFEQVAPGVLGALLDAVVCGLQRIEGVQLNQLPRMADFANWVTACEPKLGLAEAEFMLAYNANLAKANEDILESDIVAQAVLKLLEDVGQWSGTATELLEELENRASDEELRKRQRSRNWPRNASAMGNRLSRVAPNLRSKGIEVDRDRTSRSRAWEFKLAAKLAVTPVTPSSQELASGKVSTEEDHQSDRRDGRVTAPGGCPSRTTCESSGLSDRGDGGDGGDGDLQQGVGAAEVIIDKRPRTCPECGDHREPAHREGEDGELLCRCLGCGHTW